MDSTICTHVSWSPKYPSHPGCHIISSLCHKVTRCWLPILNRAVPTTHSWRHNLETLGSNLETLGSFLQPALTLFGHSRFGWVTYSGSPSPPVSLWPSSPRVSPQCPSVEHLGMPFAWNPVQFCLEPSNPPYGSMSRIPEIPSLPQSLLWAHQPALNSPMELTWSLHPVLGLSSHCAPFIHISIQPPHRGVRYLNSQRVQPARVRGRCIWKLGWPCNLWSKQGKLQEGKGDC